MTHTPTPSKSHHTTEVGLRVAVGGDGGEGGHGIIWKYRTGAPWRDVPQRYGPWMTLHDRLVRWRRDGTWDRLLALAQARSDAVGELVWVVSVDATVNRAHQHAAGARRRPAKAEPKGGRRTRRTATTRR